MTGSSAARVIVCAGGLGTRTAGWSRYIPKEFYPVGGRPGIVHLLNEIAHLGPADVVIVTHPYYAAFTAWAQTALSQHAHDTYSRAARQPPSQSPAAGLTISFITQQGPYADLTSVLNGAGHRDDAGDLYVAFADNLYTASNPLRALSRAPDGHVSVLARTYQPELAGSRGVITAAPRQDQLLVHELTEKPGPEQARALERRHGTASLFLLEGRARLAPAFIEFARGYRAPPGTEPKLAHALAAYARTHTVAIIPTTDPAIDLGEPTPCCRCGGPAARRPAGLLSSHPG